MAVKGAASTGPHPQVLQSLASASQRTGVPFDYLFNQAKMESSFDPGAKAQTSSAAGLFQFTKQTWLATLERHGAAHGLKWAADAIQKTAGGYTVADAGQRQAILDLRFDPATASAMAGEFASDNASFLQQQLSRDVDSTDLSMAHFLGPAGAAKFLTALAASPDASAAPLFPEAAQANRSVFFDRRGAPRSLAEIHGRFAAKANAETGAAPAGHYLPPVQTVVRQEFASQNHARALPERLAGFEPMPERLSLSFAQAAYRRLAAMGPNS